ncbi:MAG: aminodeoxychorismate lyase [Parahaliea sp.]
MIWVDGESSAHLPLPDRGFAFGDGLFETLLQCRGRYLFLNDHLERLQQGLVRLGFSDLSGLFSELEVQLKLPLQAVPDDVCALRLSISRGVGLRGYAPPQVPPRIVLQLDRLARDPFKPSTPVKLSLSPVHWSQQPLLAGLKHLNRLEQILAAQRCEKGFDEALMLDAQGRVISVIAGNIFARHDDRLLTPSLARCGVAGTRRRAIIERWAPAIGLVVEEVDIAFDDLLSAEELLICNALTGPRAVAELAGRCWQQYPLTEQLQAQYYKDCSGDLC